ncbi:MAG: DUF1538 domain-containing protein [Bacillota bacterium]
MAVLDILKSFWISARDIVPISAFLIVFKVFVLKSPIDDVRSLAIGLLFSSVGLFLFVQGLRIGLLPLGNSIGMNLPHLKNPGLIIAFSAVLGFTATLAEPALSSLAMEVEEISVGAVPNRLLVYTVALGVAIGMGLGTYKILYKIPPAHLLIPLSIVSAILAYFAPERIIGIAFDSGGVTTGPVTVPLNMAMAVGLATVVGEVDPLIHGFGVIGLASLGPIITVLALGIILKV